MRIDINPGYRLREFLQGAIPNDLTELLQSDNTSNDLYFVSRVDSLIRAEKGFHDLIYRSTINYVVRRLITNAIYIQRQTKDFGKDIFVTELRASLTNNFKFTSSDNEKVLILLIECLNAIAKDLKGGLKKRIRREAKGKEVSNCYICGKAVSFDKTNEHDAAEVEHVWPRSLGGTSTDENLVVACNKCNRDKKAHIDSSDYHYEYINNFINHIDNPGKIAIWSKTNYCCFTCSQPASNVGQLTLARINENDTWHYLNLVPYCSECLPNQD